MNREQARGAILEFYEKLGRCAMYAADPHCDTRDEIASILEHLGSLIDRLLDGVDGGGDDSKPPRSVTPP
jgi:hypothetical protein